MRLTDVWRYPVKSCRGEQLAGAQVEPWGLAGDRRWMIVDGDGEVVTAREHPQLVLVTPSIDPEAGVIRLAMPGLPELEVPVPDTTTARLVPVKVWRSELVAALASDEAGQWLSKVAGEEVRLVYLDDPTRRPTSPAHSQPGDVVSFADGYPLLLTSEESLAQLNDWIAAGPHAAEGPLPMKRFRPSVTVAGADAFAEDAWRLVRIGDVAFRVAKPCDRCVFTTIDPVTAGKGKEPLVTLARYRRWDGAVWFGMNLIPDRPSQGATIRVGDPVQVVR
jgi:uncharacterized protein YcbX